MIPGLVSSPGSTAADLSPGNFDLRRSTKLLVLIRKGTALTVDSRARTSIQMAQVISYPSYHNHITMQSRRDYLISIKISTEGQRSLPLALVVMIANTPPNRRQASKLEAQASG
jgi:hypothetical protein